MIFVEQLNVFHRSNDTLALYNTC